ncbi:hypothetical protein PYW08_009206 [Mythimna loreyi]|uniref:Uncharacterized protein n=1 Tax=Mythimna loreyi TaxID=667449 RepID=A0ACC2Q7Y7_9NEOP|nr:hypothetical protein PYW08_009206 [Mythimna loreyi]
MGALKAFIFATAALLIINYVSAIGHGGCPPKSKVYNNKPTCFTDADCQKYGKICCPNQFNTNTCVDRAPWNNMQDDKHNKYSGAGGGGVYCEGVKCMPYEVCKPDPFTRRMKCQRA